jgi:hypothetical protein
LLSQSAICCIAATSGAVEADRIFDYRNESLYCEIRNGTPGRRRRSDGGPSKSRIDQVALGGVACGRQQVSQSRNSFASANVDLATGPRSPMPYNFEGCAPRQASMSRKLSRYVICANAMTRTVLYNEESGRERRRHTFATMRSKLVHGTKSMTCEKSVRPVFTVMPPIGKIEEFTAKPSRRVQIDTKQNPPQPIASKRLFSQTWGLNRAAVE